MPGYSWERRTRWPAGHPRSRWRTSREHIRLGQGRCCKRSSFWLRRESWIWMNTITGHSGHDGGINVEIKIKKRRLDRSCLRFLQPANSFLSTPSFALYPIQWIIFMLQQLFQIPLSPPSIPLLGVFCELFEEIQRWILSNGR